MSSIRLILIRRHPALASGDRKLFSSGRHPWPFYSLAFFLSLLFSFSFSLRIPARSRSVEELKELSKSVAAFQSEQIWVRSDLATVGKDAEASLPPPPVIGAGLYLNDSLILFFKVSSELLPSVWRIDGAKAHRR
ncbi:hypothetical protein YC2023_016687 [Brassica napus]